MIGRQTVTVRRPTPTTNRYGDTVTGTTVTDTVVRGCAVSPRQSVELHGAGRDGVIVGLTLWAPPGTAIAAGDQVLVDGVSYDVDGEPGEWTSRGGRKRGVQVALTRTAG